MARLNNRAGTQLLCIHAITGLALSLRQRGIIIASLPLILERLNLDFDARLIRIQIFERHYQQLFSKHAIRSNTAA